MLASDLEDRLVDMDLLVLHQEAYVRRSRVVEGQTETVINAGAGCNLK